MADCGEARTGEAAEGGEHSVRNDGEGAESRSGATGGGGEAAAGGEAGSGLLVLGGEVVKVLKQLQPTLSSSVTAIPYWFHMKADLPPAPPVPSTLTSAEPSNATSTGISSTLGGADLRSAGLDSNASASTNSVPLKTIVLSTGDQDAPCNQCVLMLDEPLAVAEGEPVDLDVLWREGTFSATLQYSHVS